MEGCYEIKLGDGPVGQVQVSREGLYYRFLCRCCLTEKSVCRVYAGNHSLGVLLPADDGFVLDTKLPAKQFGDQIPDFWIKPNRPVLEGRFVPLAPEEPFAYIERLKNAYLARQNGQIGVIIKEEAGT